MEKKLSYRLQSECALICHNGQLVDPLNRYSKMLKPITSKRSKTDADLAEIARIEWYASLYLNESKCICIPSDVFEATLINAAKKLRLGNQAKAGLFVVDHLSLKFDGSDLPIDELWERDQNRLTKAVRVGSAKVMRTRFWLEDWEASAKVAFDPGLLNPQQVNQIVQVAGEAIGLCDWRPRFGRFQAKLIAQ